jgi:hypothetical protein
VQFHQHPEFDADIFRLCAAAVARSSYAFAAKWAAPVKESTSEVVAASD